MEKSSQLGYCSVQRGVLDIALNNLYVPTRSKVIFEFLGKTRYGVLPLCDDRRTPASLSLAQSEAVVYLENGLT